MTNAGTRVCRACGYETPLGEDRCRRCRVSLAQESHVRRNMMAVLVIIGVTCLVVGVVVYEIAKRIPARP